MFAKWGLSGHLWKDVKNTRACALIFKKPHMGEQKSSHVTKSKTIKSN